MNLIILNTWLKVVHKATWISNIPEARDVVLKRLYNSNNKISDILKEVKFVIY